MNVHADATAVVHHGDALDALALLPAASIDAIVTDPPYGIDFMGHGWDRFGTGRLSMMQGFEQWCRGWAIEALRVLKPGGHLLAFGGSRSWHRLAAGIEDAGFELRDSIAWLYGQGFPKSKNVDAAMAHYLEHGPTPVPGVDIDPRVFDITRQVREARNRLGWTNERVDALFGTAGMADHWCSPRSQPMVPSVEQWARLKAELGIGDDLDGLVAELGSVERGPEWGTARPDFLGGLLTGTRTGMAAGWGTALKPGFEPCVVARKPLAATNLDDNVRAYGTGALHIDAGRIGTAPRMPSASGLTRAARGDFLGMGETVYRAAEGGRWPANVILSEDAAAGLDEQSGTTTSGAAGRKGSGGFAGNYESGDFSTPYGDTGGASRFFYVAKASRAERPKSEDGTAHSTVKPLALMRHLVRLVTPPGGIVLDPFAGSGTTLEATLAEGFRGIAIERQPEYLPLILQRLERARA